MPLPSLRNLPDDPRLEGGDVLLNGREIYVGVLKEGPPAARATTPNGVRWLQRYLGPDYRVIQLDNPVVHLDGVLALLRPGLALFCRESGLQLKGSVKDWELIDVTSAEARDLGCNCLILDQQTVMMDTRPIERVAKEVENRGIEVVHIDFDAITDTVGGLRCSTHPIYRESQLEPAS
jgi:N-dimethylarginine dimethylaminohydrolase